MNWIQAFLLFLRGFFVSRAALAVENLALRQQLAILQRSTPRPKLQPQDRRFWVWLSWLWSGWKSALAIVQPETVLRWHRDGFRRFWHRKSAIAPQGRPKTAAPVVALIQRMTGDNPTWGAPRIAAERHLLGYDLAKSTVARYLPKGRQPPSQTWKTFLRNHVGALASIDFFVVPTVTFRVLYCFLVLRHDRRRVVHFNVTEQPTAAWVTQQLRTAFPFDDVPRYLIRDRDAIYGDEVKRCLKSMNIEEVVTAPRSPWQNPYVERLIGSIRRDLLDHVIVLHERHLRCLMSRYLDYYHRARCHNSLDDNSPVPREVEPPDRGAIIVEPMVGGLHHRYRRCA